MDGAWWLAIGQFTAAALMLLLAGVLLWLDAASRAVRAFVAFLILRAGILVATRVGAMDRGVLGAAIAETIPYYNLALAGALVWLLSVYPRPRGLLSFRHGKWILLAVVLMAEGVYAFARCLVICDDVPQALAFLLVAFPVASGIGAFLLFRDARAAPTPLARTSILLLAAGLLVETSLSAGSMLAFLVRSPENLSTTLGPGNALPILAWLLGVAGSFGLSSSARAKVWSLAGAAFLTALVARTSGWQAGEFIVGLWRIVLPVLAAYALARYRLFDLDLKVRVAAKRATIAGIFAGVFFVVTEGAAVLLGYYVGVLAGILAVGALVPLMAPLRQIAERAIRALPGDDTAHDGLTIERRRQLYLDFATQAWANGSMAPAERSFLDALRKKLALSAEDALALESHAASEVAREW